MSIKNMFPIEISSIQEILEEANVENIEEFNSLMEEIENLPNDIEDQNSAQIALNFIEKIKKIKNNFKQLRLEDGKIFKDGLKAVEKFYHHFENGLKTKQETLANKISVFLNNSEAAQKLESKSLKNFFSKTKKLKESEIDKNLKINREWVVSKIDIKELDLEALRDYFTEYQLKMAVIKHLKTNGPILDGVDYQRKIKT